MIIVAKRIWVITLDGWSIVSKKDSLRHVLACARRLSKPQLNSDYCVASQHVKCVRIGNAHN